MNSLRDIRIFLGLVPKESQCIMYRFYRSGTTGKPQKCRQWKKDTGMPTQTGIKQWRLRTSNCYSWFFWGVGVSSSKKRFTSLNTRICNVSCAQPRCSQGPWGKWRYTPTHSQPRHFIQVHNRLQSPADSLPVPMNRSHCGARSLLWTTVWARTSIVPVGNRTTIPQ